MLEYHAAYYRHEGSPWIMVKVLDFPGTVSQGKTLRSSRRMQEGEPLPRPNVRASDKKAFLIEPIRLSIRVGVGAAA